MLTNLDFLNLNSEWVPPEEKERISLYELNNCLYKNDHSKVLDIMLNVIYPDKAENENVKRVFINLYRSVSKLWADLLFSEKPKIQNASDTDKKLIDDIIDSNKFWKLSKKVAIDVSRYGNGVYKLRLADGKVIIDAVTPRIWFPILNPDNVNEVLHHVLAYTFIENKVQYLKAEIHSIGKIEHRLFIIDEKNNKIKQELELNTLERYAGLEAVEETNVDDFLVIPVENSMDSETAFGEDDYADINPIIAQIEVHLTKMGKDLEDQGSLKYGPKNAIDEDGNVPRNGFIGLMGGVNAENPPGVVTWAVAHEAIKAYFEQLMFFFYMLSETSPAIFEPDYAMGNISGVAIKRLMQRLLLKAGRLAENFDESITRVFKVAAELQSKTLSDYSIAWQDGLVNDALERVNIAATAISSGTMSKRTGTAFVQEIEDDALEKELEQIANEKKAETVINLEDIYGNETDDSADDKEATKNSDNNKGE